MQKHVLVSALALGLLVSAPLSVAEANYLPSGYEPYVGVSDCNSCWCRFYYVLSYLYRPA